MDISSQRRRRVLVTGGAGFLGSHLCERLIADRMDVICLDNLSTGSIGNIGHLTELPEFKFIHGNVCDGGDPDVDGIFNLACIASPYHYQKDPIGTMRSSVYGTDSMLRIAREAGCPLLQASTSEVYGDPDVHPQTEDYCGRVNPIGPRACYDEGKRCAETLCFDYNRQYDVKIKIVRIFNTYGPRMQARDGRVVPTLILQALANEPMTIYGSGEQTRSFCYVGDIIEGLISMMTSPSDITGPINIGSQEELSILQLAQEIKDLTGSRSIMRFMRPTEDDPRKRRPDIRAARQSLGWEPKVALRLGLSKTIEFFESEIRKAASLSGSVAHAYPRELCLTAEQPITAVGTGML